MLLVPGILSVFLYAKRPKPDKFKGKDKSQRLRSLYLLKTNLVYKQASDSKMSIELSLKLSAFRYCIRPTYFWICLRRVSLGLTSSPKKHLSLLRNEGCLPGLGLPQIRWWGREIAMFILFWRWFQKAQRRYGEIEKEKWEKPLKRAWLSGLRVWTTQWGLTFPGDPLRNYVKYTSALCHQCKRKLCYSFINGHSSLVQLLGILVHLASKINKLTWHWRKPSDSNRKNWPLRAPSHVQVISQRPTSKYCHIWGLGFKIWIWEVRGHKHSTCSFLVLTSSNLCFSYIQNTLMSTTQPRSVNLFQHQLYKV